MITFTEARNKLDKEITGIKLSISRFKLMQRLKSGRLNVVQMVHTLTGFKLDRGEAYVTAKTT